MLNRNPLSLKIQISYLGFFVVALLLSYILRKLYYIFPHSTVPIEPLIVQRNGGLDFNSLISPKPVERFVFLSVTTLMCVMITSFIFFVDTNNKYLKGYRLFESLYFRCFLGFGIFTTLYLTLYNSDFLGALLSIYRFGAGRPSPWLTLVVMIVGYYFGLKVCEFQLIRPSSDSLWSLWFVFISVIFLIIMAFRLYNINNISSVGQLHFDAAVYALSQVIHGKTLLVDLPSQYGLFPEIIAPLFRLLGASVFSLTAFFAVLQICSLSALFYVLSKFTKRYWFLLLLSSLTLLVVTFSTSLFFMHVREPYFQYWPIRFFWPSMSILAFYFFSLNKSTARASLISALSGLATFWNMDSGIFIVIAFGAYLSTQSLLSLSEKKSPYYWIKLTALHLTVASLVYLALLYCLVLKSGSNLNLDWLIRYQRTFYQMGFMAIPMPYRLNPWLSVLGIYLLGIISSLYSWKYHVNRLSSDMLFYVSVLGVGLFTYYEGRAHTNNLIQVFWPALVVSVLITSQILKGIESFRLSKKYCYYAAIPFSFYIICSVVFVIHLKLLASFSVETANEALKPVENQSIVILNELEFIRRHTISNKNCIILSTYPTVYYLESGVASPIKGPGLMETLLQSDQKSLEDQLALNKLNCIFYGIGKSETPVNINFQRILRRYKVSDKNSLGTMLYLVPKASDSD